MDEAQDLADRVAVIAAGRIVAEGRPTTLAGRDGASRDPLPAPAGAGLPTCPTSARPGRRLDDGGVVVRTAGPHRRPARPHRLGPGAGASSSTA